MERNSKGQIISVNVDDFKDEALELIANDQDSSDKLREYCRRQLSKRRN